MKTASLYLPEEVLERCDELGRVYRWKRSQVVAQHVYFFQRLQAALDVFQEVSFEGGDRGLVYKHFSEGRVVDEDLVDGNNAAWLLYELVRELKRGLLAEFPQVEQMPAFDVEED